MPTVGFLGELRLKIPWANLRKGVLSEPIVILIRRIFLVAGIAEDEVGTPPVHSHLLNCLLHLIVVG